jgi:hypothetical protein
MQLFKDVLSPSFSVQSEQPVIFFCHECECLLPMSTSNRRTSNNKDKMMNMLTFLSEVCLQVPITQSHISKQTRNVFYRS